MEFGTAYFTPSTIGRRPVSFDRIDIEEEKPARAPAVAIGPSLTEVIMGLLCYYALVLR